ncbi:MAG TPA: undecaprenyl-diphosphate phosphatase [Candidatus Omnitrophota bacterium]|jgi:undecaprenyl-diphosphatase|nr:undecaprenyl-diphosphate phosphatase [Candidatus Omnitrophota bacterium]
MTPIQAAILGIVEGLTEFLPVSSTGHLILAGHAMGLSGSAVDAFEIVIQAGALLAVVWLYRARIGEILAGIFRNNAGGRALLLRLIVAFLPAAVIGFLTHSWIKEHLFGPRPVAIALLLGGIAILVVERMRHRARQPIAAVVTEIPVWGALVIGLAQVLSLWPGTSRAMTTILAALLIGATPVVAAEFSFLLALPTLGAATLFDLAKHHDELLGPAMGGPAPLVIGLATAAIVAAIAIRGFLTYLTRRGLAPFGWYRIVIGILLIAVLWTHPGALG